MTKLSQPLQRMKPHYDVVVVGSGYGGGVAASRLARAGLKVCVIERGREIPTGEFPSRLSEAQGEMQITGRNVIVGSDTALYEFRTGDDVHVLVGCGLGGTSLINANVCLEPEPACSTIRFGQTKSARMECWPKAITAPARMLRPTPTPGQPRPEGRGAGRCGQGARGNRWAPRPCTSRSRTVRMRRASCRTPANCAAIVAAAAMWGPSRRRRSPIWPTPRLMGRRSSPRSRPDRSAKDARAGGSRSRSAESQGEGRQRQAVRRHGGDRDSGGRHAWLDGNPAALRRRRAGAVAPAGRTLQRQRRRPRHRLQQQHSRQRRGRRASAQGGDASCGTGGGRAHRPARRPESATTALSSSRPRRLRSWGRSCP